MVLAWFDPAETVAVAHVMIQVEMPGRIVRVNLTMNEALLARVDAAASARGMSRSGAFQASDNGLRCPHPGRDVDLDQTDRQPCVDHLANDGEDGAEAVILGLDPGIGPWLSPELRETGLFEFPMPTC